MFISSFKAYYFENKYIYEKHEKIFTTKAKSVDRSNLNTLTMTVLMIGINKMIQ